MLRIILGILMFAMIAVQGVSAQNVSTVQCGSIIEGEFSRNAQRDEYKINLRAGDILRVQGMPFGQTLQFTILALGPTDLGVSASDEGGWVRPSPFIETPELSANGTYTLWVANTRIYYDGRIFSDATDLGGVGFYNLYIGCTLRDGTIIEPGTAPDTAGSGIETASAMTRRFSGTGFPGLAPVDFTHVYKLPLSLGTPMPISIPPVGAAIIGLTLDASAGDTLALDFERTSGNLNLGIVVLSPGSEVVFQASLVTLESLSARIVLPRTGQYTIGAFRIALLPPNAPEATEFQITGTLNP